MIVSLLLAFVAGLLMLIAAASACIMVYAIALWVILGRAEKIDRGIL